MIDKWVINQRKTLKSNNFSVRGETEIPASSSFRLLTPVHVRPYRKCHVVHSRLPVPCFCCCQVILPSPSCLVSSASTFLVLFSQLLNLCTYCDSHSWLYRSVIVQGKTSLQGQVTGKRPKGQKVNSTDHNAWSPIRRCPSIGPGSLFFRSMGLDCVSNPKHPKQDLGQYPAILISQLVNDPSVVINQKHPCPFSISTSVGVKGKLRWQR